MDAARSTVLFAPNLAWRNQPLRAAVEQRTGLPVVVENDANAAAWGETRFGAGHGQRFTVTLTVGTGLGGGVVLGGELVRGAFGAAAEVGHMVLVPDGSLRVDSRQGAGHPPAGRAADRHRPTAGRHQAASHRSRKRSHLTDAMPEAMPGPRP